jgi:nucleolar MIF4G domain-containing protein 1
MLRTDSGQQLRQDDPSALKDIIGIVQTKLSNQDDFLRYVFYLRVRYHYSPIIHSNIDEYSSRTRFMIETLTNLKNNKVKRTAGQQHQGGEAVERMKKFLSGMAKKRHGAFFAIPLRTTEDLVVLIHI